jgi:threonylcarbamoyladenosine tRNA methylthiotransferase MtaB
MPGFMVKPNAVTINLHTHGCKLNQAETEDLTRRLSDAGFLITGELPADVMILNSCTVTHVADRKARQWLRQAKRSNPSGLVIVTGCYAERLKDALPDAEIADQVIGNRSKSGIIEPLKKSLGDFVKPGLSNRPEVARRIRSFLKIQDGCNRSCAYCIVPRVRPSVVSTPPDQVVNDVSKLVSAGYREVVLTGTEPGEYNGNATRLDGLVTRILKETSIERLHVSSLQPDEITSELLSLWQDKRLVQHFHLPLQSGCDRTLRAMNRHYRSSDYLQAFRLIREALPQATVTTDWMVGFPGETDIDFNDSRQFIRNCDFSAIHVFPFSPRPGTIASSLTQVPEKLKRQRALSALNLSRAKTRDCWSKLVGTVQDVLWESEAATDPGMYTGLTSSYIRVFATSLKPVTGEILPVRITGSNNKGLTGTLA